MNQFKQLFPVSTKPSELLQNKLLIKLKLENEWGDETLNDLTKLVCRFGVSSNYLHLNKVEDGCIAITWLCSTSKVKQLKIAIFEAADSLQTMGVLQVFIGEEVVLECFSAPGIYLYLVVFIHSNL